MKPIPDADAVRASRVQAQMRQEPCLEQYPIERRDTSVLQGERAGADTSVSKIGAEQQIDIIDDSGKPGTAATKTLVQTLRGNEYLRVPKPLHAWL